VNKGPHHITKEEGDHKKTVSLDSPPSPAPDSDTQPTSGGESQQERSSMQELLFQEAALIAQNLKESGTRR